MLTATSTRRRARAVVPKLTAWLPTGHLPEETWRRRHVGLTVVLALHAVGVPVLGIVNGAGPAQALLLGGVLPAGFAAAATARGWSRARRSLATTLGLLAAAVVVVHFSGGSIEAHFHFFLVVPLVALYQSWVLFLTLTLGVLLHHGWMGLAAPASVFNHAAAQQRPWLWAGIHAAYIAVLSVVVVVSWKLDEHALAEEAALRRQLERSAEALTAAQSLAGLGSWEWDVDADAMRWSPFLKQVLGLDGGSAASRRLLETCIHPRDRAAAVADMTDAVRARAPMDLEFRVVRSDGQVRIVALRGDHVATDGRVGRYFGTAQDITDRARTEERLRELAFTDLLTGLANRGRFEERLEHALAVQARSSWPTAVLFIDLDGFKEINDTHGHEAGDQLLIELADRLVRLTRAGDTVARLGGDEFVVLLESAEPRSQAAAAERILAALRRPVQTAGEWISVRASLGIADTTTADTADELLRQADEAMYAAKAAGADGWVTYHGA